MIWLLAQIFEPALQPGPIRLPGELPPGQIQPEPNQGPSSLEIGPELERTPLIESQRLSEALEQCRKNIKSKTLETFKNCASLLTGELISRGYINSRVVVISKGQSPTLELIEGKLVEIHIKSESTEIVNEARNLLRGMKNKALNINELEKELQLLKESLDVQSMQANLERLGTDRSKAVLNLSLTPTTHPWARQLSIRNDGNAGSGEGRVLLVTNKQDFAIKEDQLLFIGELDSDKDPELGYALASLSYKLPINDTIQFTSAFGISRRNLIEHEKPLHDLSYRQLQGYGQFTWDFAKGLLQRSFAFAGISVNRNDSFLGDSPVPLVAGGGNYGWLRTGFLRAGLGTTGQRPNINWAVQAYGLQGIANLSTEHQLDALEDFGIHPGQAQALGLSALTNWQALPKLQLTARLAAQTAFSALPHDMGFSLGSDSGIKGLPGQLVSGDSGYLGSLEAAYTLLEGRQNRLQVVPFIGAGEIRSVRHNLIFEDSAGAGGVVARWLQGKIWNLELGWVAPFETGDRGVWDDWFLSQGLYTKLVFRF